MGLTASDRFIHGVECGLICGITTIVLWKFYGQFIRRYKFICQPAKPCSPKYLMALVYRGDLRISHGKIASQLSHGAVGAYKNATENYLEDVEKWKETGMHRTYIKVSKKSDLIKPYCKAVLKSLPKCIIADAGRTQVTSGTITAVVIGPAVASEVESIVQSIQK